MNNNYVYVKELAERLLDIALKYDELDKFIIAYPGYEVHVNDGAGNQVNSIDAIMQAIYEKYNADSSIQEKLFAAISSRLNSTKNRKTLLYLIDLIKYQLREEESNNSPFKLDCMELLELASANISRNIDVYSRAFKEYTNGFIEEFKICSQTLETIYGFKLI